MAINVFGATTFARHDGDDFVVRLSGLDSMSQATSIIDRLRSSLDQPFHIGGTERVVVTAFTMGELTTHPTEPAAAPATAGGA